MSILGIWWKMAEGKEGLPLKCQGWREGLGERLGCIRERKCAHVPLFTLRMWCLSRDQPPRLEGSSSNPWRRAVLFSHRIRLGQVSYSNPTDTERQKGVWQGGRQREWTWLFLSSQAGRRETRVCGNTDSVPKTQGGGLIAFLLVTPHNIKFKFQAELNLETLHSGILWGWKDLSKEELAFKNDPSDVEGGDEPLKNQHDAPSEMHRRLLLSDCCSRRALLYFVLFIFTHWRKAYGSFVAHL